MSKVEIQVAASASDELKSKVDQLKGSYLLSNDKNTILMNSQNIEGLVETLKERLTDTKDSFILNESIEILSEITKSLISDEMQTYMKNSIKEMTLGEETNKKLDALNQRLDRLAYNQSAFNKLVTAISSNKDTKKIREYLRLLNKSTSNKTKNRVDRYVKDSIDMIKSDQSSEEDSERSVDEMENSDHLIDGNDISRLSEAQSVLNAEFYENIKAYIGNSSSILFPRALYKTEYNSIMNLLSVVRNSKYQMSEQLIDSTNGRVFGLLQYDKHHRERLLTVVNNSLPLLEFNVRMTDPSEFQRQKGQASQMFNNELDRHNEVELLRDIERHVTQSEQSKSEQSKLISVEDVTQSEQSKLKDDDGYLVSAEEDESEFSDIVTSEDDSD